MKNELVAAKIWRNHLRFWEAEAIFKSVDKLIK